MHAGPTASGDVCKGGKGRIPRSYGPTCLTKTAVSCGTAWHRNALRIVVSESKPELLAPPVPQQLKVDKPGDHLQLPVKLAGSPVIRDAHQPVLLDAPYGVLDCHPLAAYPPVLRVLLPSLPPFGFLWGCLSITPGYIFLIPRHPRFANIFTFSPLVCLLLLRILADSSPMSGGGLSFTMLMSCVLPGLPCEP